MATIGLPLVSLKTISTRCSLSIPEPLEKKTERGSLEENGSVIFCKETISSLVNLILIDDKSF